MAGCAGDCDTDLLCLLCSAIEAGRLAEVRKYIQAERDVCQCETKQPVYRVIKFYQRYLRQSQQDSMAKASVWKSTEVYTSNTRALVLEVIAKLLAGGAHLNYTTGLETPLMAALSTCDEELLWLLLDFKADVGQCDGPEDMNALGLAILLNEVNLVEMLLKQGAKVNALCCGNLVPIQLAMNKTSAVSNLLIQYGADMHLLRTMSLDDKVFTSQSPLHVAILRKNVHLARLLLEHGEDVNQTFNDSLESPVHQAVRHLDLDMIQLLIEFGADLNRPNFERHTPLGLALVTDDHVSTEIAKKLVKAGASANQRTRISFFQNMYTPLHIACFKGNLEFVRFLVEEVCGRDGYWDEEEEVVSEAAGGGGSVGASGGASNSSSSRSGTGGEHSNSIMEHYFKLLPRNERCWATTPSLPTTPTRPVRLSHRAPTTTTTTTRAASPSVIRDRKDYHTRSEVAPSSSDDGAAPQQCEETSRDASVSSAVKSEKGAAQVQSGSRAASHESQEAALCTSCNHVRQSSVGTETRTQNTEAKEHGNIVFTIGDEVLGKPSVTKRPTINTGICCCDISAILGVGGRDAETLSGSKVEDIRIACATTGAADSSAEPGSTATEISGRLGALTLHSHTDTTQGLTGRIPTEEKATAGTPDDPVNPATIQESNLPVETGEVASADPVTPVFQAEFGSPDYVYPPWEGQRGVVNRSATQQHAVARFLNQEDADGSTALFMAVYDGNVELVDYLLRHGANPHFSSHHGNFFHAAVLSQSLPLLCRALQLGCAINEHNVFGNSPLALQSRLDMPEVCELLVSHGADMNSRDRYRETPLLASVYFGCEMNARILIQHGAALDLVDDNLTSAIYWSIFNNRQRTLKLLLMAGASFSPQVFDQYPRSIRVMRNRPLFHFIQRYIYQPRSLLDLATISIRVHLGDTHRGRSILRSVHKLPIPNRLKEILSLQHFIQAIDSDVHIVELENIQFED